VIKGEYPGTWFALTEGTFGDAGRSSDFLLRIYTIQTDFQTINGGSGSAIPVTWIELTDPRGRLGDIALAKSRARNLTGADLTPRALVRLPSGTFWVADAKNNQLLRFDKSGKLNAAPIALNGAVVGLSVTPSGSALIVALRDGQIQSADPDSGAVTGTVGAYGVDGGNQFGGLTMINDGQALVVESDGNDGASGSKRVYLADIGSGSKQLLVDLLNIDDANGLSGLGSPFTFPYAAINSVYPVSGNSLMVVNNNRVPFGQGRQAGVADATEYIIVAIGQGLNVDLSLFN
jgi:hypothetical protein